MEKVRSQWLRSVAAGLPMYGRDFLATWDKPWPAIELTVYTAQLIRELYAHRVPLQFFRNQVAVSIFKDLSTRTKYSFESAANLMGLAVHDLDEKQSQIGHGETVMETANMISFLTGVIGIRDDKYVGVGHAYQQQVAAAVAQGFAEGGLLQQPPVINLQSDEDHPTQSMSDLLHLTNYFGGLDKIRGKKITISWAYSPTYGKPLSVPQGALGLFSRLGAELTLAHPEGYELLPHLMDKAATQAKQSGGSLHITHDMSAAFKGADVVYPKSWGPYEKMLERPKLLAANDQAGLMKLQKAELAQNAKHQDWECDEAKMKLTKGGKALYLHCLPADISGVSCERGEVAESVFNRYRAKTYQQASYKPFVIAAMMLLGAGGQAGMEWLEKISAES